MTEDGFRAIIGALQIWDTEHNWPWQITKTEITFNEGIDTYALPTSIAYKALLDIRPKAQDAKKTEFEFMSNNKFDSDSISTYKVAVKTEDQKKYLRLKYNGQSQTLNDATTVNSNGTWVGATAISNVAQDLYESFSGRGSLKFDYSGTTGTLTNSDMTAKNVERYAQRSTIYFDIYLQDVTDFTSITLKVGSSDSDYITSSITTDYLGNPLVTGWNRCSLVWNGSTTVVGTLDTTGFDYLQVTLAYSSNPSTVSNRIENFFISENIPVVLEYYSHFMVQDISADNAKLKFFNDSGATGDKTLWSEEWDFVNEAFVNSVLEMIFWMTGETEDRGIAIERIRGFLEPLKAKIPSRQRYPKMQIVPDLNL
jgi:hypothetical protein